MFRNVARCRHNLTICGRERFNTEVFFKKKNTVSIACVLEFAYLSEHQTVICIYIIYV